MRILQRQKHRALVWCGQSLLAAQEKVGLGEVLSGCCSSAASQEEQGALPRKSDPSNAEPTVQVGGW